MAQKAKHSSVVNDNIIDLTSSPKCVINVLEKIAKGNFVIVDTGNSCRIAKVLDIFDKQGKQACVRWYMSKRELPAEVWSGEQNEHITLHKSELVEWGIKSENIQFKQILTKCLVFYAHEYDSVSEILEAKKGTSKSSGAQMYVCRYKLVKQTIYKLLPVSWSNDDEELQNQESEYTEDDYDDDRIDRASQLPNCDTLNLSSRIDNLYLDITERNHKTTEHNKSGKTVTPLKISKNSVQKVKRSRNEQKHEENNCDNHADDVAVSPTKRTKFTNEQNQNYNDGSSPTDHNEYDGSPSPDKMNKMTKVRKNLNSSFMENMDELNESAKASPKIYSSKIVDGSSVKMVLRKKTPLKEKYDNNTTIHGTPSQTLHNKILTSCMEMDGMATPKRRSILKVNGSNTKGTPRRSVVIREDANFETKSDVFETPSRRSRRISSMNASAKIQIEAQDVTPEAPKLRTPSAKKRESQSARMETPKSSTRRLTITKTPTSSTLTPQRSRQLYRSGNLTPSIQSREAPIREELTELEQIRERLHVSAVPNSLPCREKEFSDIYSFIFGKLTDGSGGCIYISGVPGTGKTATVTQVIKQIQADSKPRKLPPFDYIDINGMRLTEPRQAYVQIYRQLTGKTLAWAQARDLLEARFTETSSKKSTKTTILLVDELDIICNRKQDVVYNLFDWTSRKGSRLVAITIANTMDLPERVLKLKVASRLGLTRITFQPYSFKQLQEVVMARLAGSKCFVSDAVQLVARKVASVSGDCRRALDICRRATEIAEESSSKAKDHIVNFTHVNQALSEMFTSPKVRAIKSCTKFEKLFLQAVASEITRTGIEEVDFYGVFVQMNTLAPILGINSPPTEDQAMLICVTLGASRLIIAEDSSAGLYQKIILNVSVDDLYYALNG